jgi:hypothetical protein
MLAILAPIARGQRTALALAASGWQTVRPLESPSRTARMQVVALTGQHRRCAHTSDCRYVCRREIQPFLVPRLSVAVHADAMHENPRAVRVPMIRQQARRPAAPLQYYDKKPDVLIE